MSSIQHTDWDKEVLREERPVVVEFWHQNCPTCKKLEPTFIPLTLKLSDKAKFVRINVMDSRDNRRLAIEKGVVGTPTLKVYCRGVERGEVVGLETLTNLESTLLALFNQCI